MDINFLWRKFIRSGSRILERTFIFFRILFKIELSQVVPLSVCYEKWASEAFEISNSSPEQKKTKIRNFKNEKWAWVCIAWNCKRNLSLLLISGVLSHPHFWINREYNIVFIFLILCQQDKTLKGSKEAQLRSDHLIG